MIYWWTHLSWSHAALVLCIVFLAVLAAAALLPKPKIPPVIKTMIMGFITLVVMAVFWLAFLDVQASEFSP